jgi:hypothetical protein
MLCPTKNVGWRLVADVVRHLNAAVSAAVSTSFGILTNSAIQKVNCAVALQRNHGKEVGAATP